jgi:hypothetical protein
MVHGTGPGVLASLLAFAAPGDEGCRGGTLWNRSLTDLALAGDFPGDDAGPKARRLPGTTAEEAFRFGAMLCVHDMQVTRETTFPYHASPACTPRCSSVARRALC